MKLANFLSLEKIYNEVKTKKLPIKTTYKFAKLINLIDSERIIFSQTMQDIIETYGARDDKNELIPEANGFKIQQDKVEECQIKVQELYDIEIDIPFTFKIDELESTELSVENMELLLPLIEE